MVACLLYMVSAVVMFHNMLFGTMARGLACLLLALWCRDVDNGAFKVLLLLAVAEFVKLMFMLYFAVQYVEEVRGFEGYIPILPLAVIIHLISIFFNWGHCAGMGYTLYRLHRACESVLYLVAALFVCLGWLMYYLYPLSVVLICIGSIVLLAATLKE